MRLRLQSGRETFDRTQQSIGSRHETAEDLTRSLLVLSRSILSRTGQIWKASTLRTIWTLIPLHFVFLSSSSSLNACVPMQCHWPILCLSHGSFCLFFYLLRRRRRRRLALAMNGENSRISLFVRFSCWTVSLENTTQIYSILFFYRLEHPPLSLALSQLHLFVSPPVSSSSNVCLFRACIRFFYAC